MRELGHLPEESAMPSWDAQHSALQQLGRSAPPIPSLNEAPRDCGRLHDAQRHAAHAHPAASAENSATEGVHEAARTRGRARGEGQRRTRAPEAHGRVQAVGGWGIGQAARVPHRAKPHRTKPHPSTHRSPPSPAPRACCCGQAGGCSSLGPARPLAHRPFHGALAHHHQVAAAPVPQRHVPWAWW